MRERDVIRITHALILAGMLCGQANAFECSGDEVGYFATFKVREGSEGQFEALAAALTDEVRAREPGVVFYAPYRGEDPGVYYFMERYETEAARDAHASAEEIRGIFGQVMPLLSEPLTVVRLSALCP